MSDNASMIPLSPSEITTDHMADLVGDVAKHRDRAAFTALFDFYAPRIKAFLIRSTCPPALAEEVTQDVMITLWQKAHMFDREKSSLGTWLFRIARNRRIDLIRRDKSDKLDAQDPTLFPTITEINQEGVDAIARDRQIRLAIASLPAEQSQLIRLSFFESQSHGQISEELNLPLGTVKSRIRLAFNRLRKELSENAKVDVD